MCDWTAHVKVSLCSVACWVASLERARVSCLSQPSYRGIDDGVQLALWSACAANVLLSGFQVLDLMAGEVNKRSCSSKWSCELLQCRRFSQIWLSGTLLKLLS